MGSRWVINVPVATVWTSFDSPRDIDLKAISNPMDIEGWLQGLNYEQLLHLCDENRVQTQGLFGEEVLVIDEIDGWAHVILVDQPSSKDVRGYPGWIPKAQITMVESWDSKPASIAVVKSKKAILFGEDHQPSLLLSYQTVLPVIRENNEWIYVQTPIGKCQLKKEDVEIAPSFAERKKGNGHELVAAGEQFLNLPYLWGGMSSFGYDCSGFSYNLCKANGYQIPRDAHDQAKSGKSVELTEIQPGDLIFFAYEEGKGSIHHVGIYYDDGKMIHSPKTGKTIEIIEITGKIYEKELCAASRYW
ncbi:C40 family peptidase [Robertmurraya massiliosenegalensis]|uniref:C40 family peptidase n=1 Tax=Robertmurraya TaxID=2837507 RepID=UPI0039A4987E